MYSPSQIIKLQEQHIIKTFGSKEEDEVAGFFVFSHIRIRGYFRLVRKKKSYCENTKKPVTSFSSFDPNILSITRPDYKEIIECAQYNKSPILAEYLTNFLVLFGLVSHKK